MAHGIATENVETGDIVSYEDMANPLRNFMVVKVNDCPWSTFELVSVDGDFYKTVTDGRQNGWKVVKRWAELGQR